MWLTRMWLLLASCFALVAANSPSNQSAWSHTYVDGTTLKISSVAPGIVRVRTIPRGAQENFTSVDLTLPQPSPPPALSIVSSTPAGWVLGTDTLHIHVSALNAVYNLTRPDGTMLSSQLSPLTHLHEEQCGNTAGGFLPGGCLRAERSIAADEQLFGGGVQLYAGPGQVGNKLFLRTNAIVGTATPGWSHTVSPLFFSTLGYAFLANTHALSYFDIGSTTHGVNAVHVSDPVFDLYFFAGPNNHALLGQYTALTGRMSMPPKWAMGLWYHPQEQSNQSQVLEVVDSFAQNKVPLAALTLEPPWQTHAYSCTYVWNPKKFWDPAGFIKTLNAEKNVQLTLWEHAYVANSTTAGGSPLFSPLLEEQCVSDWVTWSGLTPDFTLESTKRLYQAYHKKTFLDIGVAGFKLDECDGNPGDPDPVHPDQKIRWFFPDNASFPSGLTGAQMHNIYGYFYGDTFHDMYRQAGLRTFLKARAMYTGSQRHPTTFYSDSYDYKNYILGVVNSGFGGWAWSPEVRSAASSADFARRSQLMLFSALASMDGWSTGFVPWNSSIVDPAAEAMFKKYSQERAKLQPFLYTAYSRQGQTGVPVARALIVDFDLDAPSQSVADQFLLGDGLMVAPVGADDVTATSRQVRFPVGQDWVSYWDPNTTFTGNSTQVVDAALTVLPLFQRKGSVIPLIDLDGNGSVLVLRTHASGLSSAARVYDDDGISTKAELDEAYFEMVVSTAYTSRVPGQTTPSVVLTARVKSAGWAPTWNRLRWDVYGPEVTAWRGVTCAGVELDPATDWSINHEQGKATIWLPAGLRPVVGWEVSCSVQ